jgi:hypothetical protein
MSTGNGSVTPEETRKAKADADAAETAARKAKREEEEASSPAAVARRAVIAEKDAAAARRDQISALIPDFSKVSRGELEVAHGGEPAAGTAVAGKALHEAADLIKQRVIGRIGADTWCILVTSDTELAASDAVYWDVVSGIDHLTDLSNEVLKVTAPAGGDAGRRRIVPAGAAAVVGAVAQAVPGILSLLSTHRTVTTGKIDMDDIAALAAVAGAIKGGNEKRMVFHDSIRLLPNQDEGVRKQVKALHKCREALIKRKNALETHISAGEDKETRDHQAESIALLASVSATIDQFVKDLTSIPTGATHSSLTTAVMREGLHDETFTHVLMVKAQSASGMQVINDKLIREDSFAVVAAASISWVLIDVPDGDVQDAGVTTGTAQANGRIGDRFSFDRMSSG